MGVFYFFKAAELDFSSASESGQLKSSKADNIMKNLRSSRDNKQLPGNIFEDLPLVLDLFIK